MRELAGRRSRYGVFRGHFLEQRSVGCYAQSIAATPHGEEPRRRGSANEGYLWNHRVLRMANRRPMEQFEYVNVEYDFRLLIHRDTIDCLWSCVLLR